MFFAVAFLAAPASASAAAWDHVYFPTALPENYPPGPWVRTFFIGPTNSVSLEAGKLCLDFAGEFGAISWLRDSSMDPALASAEMTVEWSQDVAAAGFWSLQVGDVTLSYIESSRDGTVLRSFAFQGVSIDASSGRGQHVWRIVRRAFVSELWRDGTRIATAGSGSGATGFVSLFFFGNRGPVTTFRGCTSYVSYTEGAFTPAELPSPQGAGPVLEIALNPESVPPSKLDGVTLSHSAVIIRAKDSQGNPLPNLEVVLSSGAVQTSGGHDGPDHPGNRPAGFFTGGTCTAQSRCSTITCTTDSNGDCVVTGPGGPQAPIYNASELGGEETISAQLASTPSVSTSATLAVAVAPLQDFPPFSSLFPFTQWKLTGQKTNFCGSSALSIHPSNHWFAPTIHNKIIFALQNFFFEEGRVQVGINDMSLQNGGLFDICGQWKSPSHICHRTGASVDIDFAVDSAEAKVFSRYMDWAGAKIVFEKKSLHYQFPSNESRNSKCAGKPITRKQTK